MRTRGGSGEPLVNSREYISAREKRTEPRLVISFQTYQAYVKRAYAEGDRGLAWLLVAEWQIEDGHPRVEYTREFWSKREARSEPPAVRVEVEEAVSALSALILAFSRKERRRTRSREAA